MVATMAHKQQKVIKKTARRTPTAKLIDVRSPLAKQMLHLVVQFDLAYDHLKAHWKEVGGIPEQEGLVLMANARLAVEAFSVFMAEFSEKTGFDYCPPKGGNSRNQTD
jgi:hypothetical protein